MDRKRKKPGGSSNKAGAPAKQARACKGEKETDATPSTETVVLDGDDDVEEEDSATGTRDLLSMIGAGGADDSDGTAGAVLTPPPLQIGFSGQSAGAIALGGDTSTPLVASLAPLLSPDMMKRAAASAAAAMGVPGGAGDADGTGGAVVGPPPPPPQIGVAGQSAGPIALGGDTSKPLVASLAPLLSPDMMKRAAASASAAMGVPAAHAPLLAAAANANAGQNVATLAPLLSPDMMKRAAASSAAMGVPAAHAPLIGVATDANAGQNVANLQAQVAPDAGQDVANPQPQPAPGAAGADGSCPACRIRPATLKPPDHPCLCEECLAADAACPVCAAGPPAGGA